MVLDWLFGKPKEHYEVAIHKSNKSHDLEMAQLLADTKEKEIEAKERVENLRIKNLAQNLAQNDRIQKEIEGRIETENITSRREIAIAGA